MTHTQPGWTGCDPVPNGTRRVWVLQFAKHGLWDHDLAVQFRKNIDVSNEDQIIQRRGVCDDDHFSLNFRAFSMSRSRSCSLYRSGTPCSFKKPWTWYRVPNSSSRRTCDSESLPER